jgi:hypothetical protein
MPKTNPPPRISFSHQAAITEDVVSRILNHYKCDNNSNNSKNNNNHRNKMSHFKYSRV